MYTYIKSLALSRSIGSQWNEPDLSNILVFDIFTNYSKVFLTLTNPVLSTEVYVDLDVLKEEFSSYSGTLTALLILLDNRTIPAVPTIPNSNIKFARYSDATRSKYKINITKIGTVVPSNYPKDELNDLVVVRPKYDTDMSLLHTHCLVSVNGYYHMTDTDGVSAFVYDGGSTMHKSKMNHMGIFSFLDIGAINKVKILPSDITPQSITSTLKEKIYFSVNANIEDKSVILILGGYLVFPGTAFYRTGDTTFVLDLNKLPYVERIFESSLYLDMSGLMLTEQALNPDAINMDELWSDNVIKRYMTLSQSYLAVVDTPNLLTNHIQLRHSELPGIFSCYQDPKYPLMVNYGKSAEYWKTYEDKIWTVTVEDSFLRNYIVSQQPVFASRNISDNMNSSKPYWHSRGYLLEVSSY
jgi:hypothetical protein